MINPAEPADRTPTEATPALNRQQGRMRVTVADAITALRLPLALAFPLVHGAGWRVAILLLAAASDLLDGVIARRIGSSRLGVFLDPVADKLFMASAFGVVLFSGELAWYEIVGVLLRDIVATAAFVNTALHGHPASIPARAGGKAVTVGQALTLLAFVAGSPLLRPLAWGTAAMALYAIWDYTQAAGKERQPL